MTSQINPNVIVDNQPVDKADLRNQLTTAKNEITRLQLFVRPIRRMLYDNTLMTRN